VQSCTRTSSRYSQGNVQASQARASLCVVVACANTDTCGRSEHDGQRVLTVSLLYSTMPHSTISCGGKGAPVAGCPCAFCRRVRTVECKTALNRTRRIRHTLAVLLLSVWTFLVPTEAFAATCSAGGSGTTVACNNESALQDIRTLIGWLVGATLFLVILPVISRTFRA